VPFTPAESVTMLKKMLGAVEFIHQVGILHRDISPDNILIDKTGNPVLIDFGAASEQTAQATRVLTGRRVIKEGYSPQEFYLTGADQGPSSDLYSLGATFYHVISGKAPPESPRRLARVAEGDPDPYEPLAGRFPGYPTGFLALIDKAMRVLPKDRMQSATEWLEWIARGEAGEEPPIAPPRAVTRQVDAASSGPVSLRDPSRARGAMIGIGALVAVAAALGLWALIG
jgi:serine/threonine protein kinase